MCAPEGGDAMCAATRPGVEGVTCDNALAYSVNSANKTYSCDATSNPVLDPILSLSCSTASTNDMPPLSVNPDGSGPMVDVRDTSSDKSTTGGGHCRCASIDEHSFRQLP